MFLLKSINIRGCREKDKNKKVAEKVAEIFKMCKYKILLFLIFMLRIYKQISFILVKICFLKLI